MFLICIVSFCFRRIQLLNIGRDMSVYFPDVVKIMVTEHPELKKLVFNYVLAYASDNQVSRS